MYIEHLSLRQFRNIRALDVDVAASTVVLRGPNAQGKTNILEALYVTATGKSFRHATSDALILHGESHGQLQSRFVRHGVRHDVKVMLDSKRRYLNIDGRGVQQRTKLLDLVNVIAFFPDDLALVKGSPEQRRRFLDRAIANHQASFVAASTKYGKALKSRNAILKSSKRPDPAMLAVFDSQLVEYGTHIYQARHHTLRALQPFAEEHFRRIMGAQYALQLSLLRGFSGAEDLSPDSFADVFLQALQQARPRDLATGQTTVGPHRGDVGISLNGHAAREFASQGQQRAIVLALKLAEVQHLRAMLGTAPIVILDDVSSELDTHRTAHLFKEITASNSQVWLSTTGSAPLPIPADAQLFEVLNGSLNPA